MTLTEAIEHCETQGREETQCGLEHKQLAGWLKEVEKLQVQRANWRSLVIDLVNQFALETDKGLISGGSRDLEDAFSALELEELCSRQELWNKREE